MKQTEHFFKIIEAQRAVLERANWSRADGPGKCAHLQTLLRPQGANIDFGMG